MEQTIRQLIRNLRVQFYIFWMIPLLLVLAFELDWLDVGMYAGNEGVQYVLETIGILIAVCCIPVSLKLFSIVLINRIDKSALSVAIKRYLLWSGVRLGLLEIAVLFNLVVYYLTLHNVGALCALAGLTASVFCLPGEKRMREELHIITDDI